MLILSYLRHSTATAQTLPNHPIDIDRLTHARHGTAQYGRHTHHSRHTHGTAETCTTVDTRTTADTRTARQTPAPQPTADTRLARPAHWRTQKRTDDRSMKASTDAQTTDNSRHRFKHNRRPTDVTLTQVGTRKIQNWPLQTGCKLQ